MLSNAILLATKAHFGQYDRGGKPYILHSLVVLHKLRSNDEELQAGAVLHDVVEDTGTTYKDLRDAGMSERVVDMVRGVTKVPGETPEEYEERVLANYDSMRIKEADLQHNSDIRRLKGVTEKDVARTVKYQKFFTKIRDRRAEIEKVNQ